MSRTKRTFVGAVVAATAALTVLSAGPAQGASDRAVPARQTQTADLNRVGAIESSSFVSFGAFLTEVSHARYQAYATLDRTGAVRSERTFEQMRSYVLHMYEGVQVAHSYVDDGEYFDCVTIASQPTVRAFGVTRLATPPPPSSVDSKGARPGTAAPSRLTLGLKDPYGNTVACPAGTVPMERISLQRLTRFASVGDFLAKEPARNRTSGIEIAAQEHRYAHAYQGVKNYGGNSWLNLWNPSGEFSLSQHWYTTGSYALNNLQSAEGGWIHYPDKFGSKSVLFIYFTPDTYKEGGKGCYNLDCTGFIQTNSKWALGGSWSRYSSYGGPQYGFMMQWKYYNGNWWLFLQGSGALEAVGYYPGSVYNGGEMSRNATQIDYGGETCCMSPWPQMGSGKFPSEGWSQAAYQRTIFYTTQNGSGGTGVWASLTPSEAHPACYKIIYTPSSRDGNWGTYIYFGGPGGNC